VTVTAAEGQKPLNEQAMSLSLSDLSTNSPRSTSHPLSQTAPGTYEATLPSPPVATLVTVRVGETPVDRFAVAGRYAAEFDAIGNDRAVMQQLAGMSGGRVIETTQTTPIDFGWPPKRVPITPWIATAGGVCMAFGLILWKRRVAVG
jgi:hypothetical protein